MVPLVLCGDVIHGSLEKMCGMLSALKQLHVYFIVIFSSLCTYRLFVEADYVMGALPVTLSSVHLGGVELSVNSELVS